MINILGFLGYHDRLKDRSQGSRDIHNSVVNPSGRIEHQGTTSRFRGYNISRDVGLLCGRLAPSGLVREIRQCRRQEVSRIKKERRQASRWQVATTVIKATKRGQFYICNYYATLVFRGFFPQRWCYVLLFKTISGGRLGGKNQADQIPSS